MWSLYNYFDVWGNKKDGYEVNDLCKECDDIYIDETSTNKEICTYLKNAGWLTTDDMRKLYVEDLGDVIEIYERKTMKPLYSLRKNM